MHILYIFHAAVQTCKHDLPDYSSCLRLAMQEAWPNFLPGIKKYKYYFFSIVPQLLILLLRYLLELMCEGDPFNFTIDFFYICNIKI